jgi:ketosteroid isomerase-like protein
VIRTVTDRTNNCENRVKIHLLVALAGFAIACAVPALAQDGSNVDSQVREEIEAALTKFEEAFNKQDATAIAMLFTLDAVLVLDWGEGGTFSGQQAIEKNYAIDFASSPPKFAEKLVHMYAIGDAISAISEWSQGLWKGYHTRIYVRESWASGYMATCLESRRTGDPRLQSCWSLASGRRNSRCSVWRR